MPHPHLPIPNKYLEPENWELGSKYIETGRWGTPHRPFHLPKAGLSFTNLNSCLLKTWSQTRGHWTCVGHQAKHYVPCLRSFNVKVGEKPIIALQTYLSVSPFPNYKYYIHMFKCTQHAINKSQLFKWQFRTLEPSKLWFGRFWGSKSLQKISEMKDHPFKLLLPQYSWWTKSQTTTWDVSQNPYK